MFVFLGLVVEDTVIGKSMLYWHTTERQNWWAVGQKYRNYVGISNYNWQSAVRLCHKRYNNCLKNISLNLFATRASNNVLWTSPGFEPRCHPDLWTIEKPLDEELSGSITLLNYLSLNVIIIGWLTDTVSQHLTTLTTETTRPFE